MHIRWAYAVVALGSIAVNSAHAQASPALQDARRHWLDANVNVLTFHSIDQIFPTRRVEASGSPWVLPHAERPLDFTYDYAGKAHPAMDIVDRTYTNALIIVKHGKIVSEIYRNQTDAASHFISFSMAKSITSILVGLALADGRIHSLDDQITQYVPELKESAYDGVTIRQALDMRSGANYVEQYVVGHPDLLSAAFEESFVENRLRFVSLTRAMTRAYPPGEHYNYSTFETCVLGWVLERATKQSITQYMTDRLWKPAGMESYGFWMLDGAPEVGREFNGGGFNAIARDYARLGLLMLRNGKAGSRQVVPAAWVRESTVPAVRKAVDPDEPSFGYHFQWWPLVDSDAYMARGLQGQAIYIDPSTDTVVVKLSYFPPGNQDAFVETVAFLRAASRWQIE
ncbi:MAG TPA: serine hydrolase [Steroidobacteraceae bacterium]|jgi:CubicO group peptidase (beta-lactamase class C family)|nr:serine hydrolase [Steroidobacteraceae bacterium]